MRKFLSLLAVLLILCGCAEVPEETVPEYVLTYAENQPEGYPTVLGAEPVTFPYGDVRYAFEMGKIDAAENNWAAYAMLKHYELARYYTVDQHSRVPEIQLASARVWEKLPEGYRQIIADCARESALYQRELWKETQSQYRADAIEGGCREILLTAGERAEFRQKIEPLYQQYCGEYMDLVDQIRNG